MKSSGEVVAACRNNSEVKSSGWCSTLAQVTIKPAVKCRQVQRMKQQRIDNEAAQESAANSLSAQGMHRSYLFLIIYSVSRSHCNFLVIATFLADMAKAKQVHCFSLIPVSMPSVDKRSLTQQSLLPNRIFCINPIPIVCMCNT